MTRLKRGRCRTASAVPAFGIVAGESIRFGPQTLSWLVCKYGGMVKAS